MGAGADLAAFHLTLVELMRRENENYLFLLGDRPLASSEISSKARMQWGGFSTSEL